MILSGSPLIVIADFIKSMTTYSSVLASLERHAIMPYERRNGIKYVFTWAYCRRLYHVWKADCDFMIGDMRWKPKCHAASSCWFLKIRCPCLIYAYQCFTQAENLYKISHLKASSRMFMNWEQNIDCNRSRPITSARIRACVKAADMKYRRSLNDGHRPRVIANLIIGVNDYVHSGKYFIWL